MRQREYRLGRELSELLGVEVLSRPEVISRVWGYVKSKGLFSKRVIRPDPALAKVLGKSGPVGMFEMPRLLERQIGEVVE